VKVSGNDAVRVLEVAEGAELTLKDLTIADGAVLGRDRVSGGGIHSEGTLTLTNSTIEDNGSAAAMTSSAVASPTMAPLRLRTPSSPATHSKQSTAAIVEAPASGTLGPLP
jgi:hypothetical protein